MAEDIKNPEFKEPVVNENEELSTNPFEPFVQEPFKEAPIVREYGVKGYNINRFFNASGETKNPTLDELNSIMMARKQGVDPNFGEATARDVVKAIFNRAGINESPQKKYLENIFTWAMEDFINDPIAWQNSQSPFAGGH